MAGRGNLIPSLSLARHEIEMESQRWLRLHARAFFIRSFLAEKPFVEFVVRLTGMPIGGGSCNTYGKTRQRADVSIATYRRNTL